MRLRELFENIYEEVPAGGEEFDNSLKTIGICYGRWNPPHKGHRHVWEEAAKNPIWYVGTNQNTEGPKDPLPYEVKLQVMQAIWPKVAGHVIPEQDLFVMATRIYEKYGQNVHLKVYTDEEWLASGLQKYNGQMDAKHGGYKFAQIDHVKTERLARATDLRAAVLRGDKKLFYRDAGIKPSATIMHGEQALPIFDVVAYYLTKYPQKTAKVAKVAEGISVKPSGKMHKDAIDAGQGYSLVRDVGGYDRIYHMNRFMMAMGMADGRSKKPVDMDASSWYEKYNIAFPYTDIEAMMVNQAMATIPTDGAELEKRGKSKEPKDTNITSAVAKIKKNKYGI